MSAFIDGLRDGTLALPRCNACRRFHAPARLACPHCGAGDIGWYAARPQGTVRAITLAHRAPDASFRDLAPYALLLVAMDEGMTLMGHGDASLSIGDRVTASHFDHQRQPLLQFRKSTDD